MLQSIAIILLLGLILSKLSEKIKIPGLVGMIIAGILISKFIDEKTLNVSIELRKIALIVILTRSGLTLDFNKLKKVGRPSILLSFLPATFEIVACTIIAPLIFKISYLESALLGSVLAAVSPAVVSPRMIKMIENKIGTKKGIPEMILAGASVDDVYVIVFFTVFLTLLTKNTLSYMQFIYLPISIISGIILGIILGRILIYIFNKIQMTDITKMIVLISISFLSFNIEKILPVSVLLSIMVTGMYINAKSKVISKELSLKYNTLWKVFEILLFTLVGISLKIKYLKTNIFFGIILLLLILIFRLLAVYISTIKTKLTLNEKFFCMCSYIPKATVQAAIGGLPLAMGVKNGDLILAISVISIIFTAPIGAFCIDNFQNLLEK